MRAISRFILCQHAFLQFFLSSFPPARQSAPDFAPAQNELSGNHPQRATKKHKLQQLRQLREKSPPLDGVALLFYISLHAPPSTYGRRTIGRNEILRTGPPRPILTVIRPI